MTKLIRIDKMNSIVILFELLSLCWCKRGGKAYCIEKQCHFELSMLPKYPIHTYGYYIQIGKWGGHIMWKSRHCLEK